MLNICWQSYHLCLKILAVVSLFWNSYINFILYLIQSWTKIVGTLVHNSVFFFRYSSSILPSPPFNVVLLWTRRANFIAYHVWLQHWFRGVGSVKINMTSGAPCSFKCKQGLQGRKRQGRQIDGEKDERGAMQFQVQAGAPGKKMSGAPNWRRKGREGRHAVSSASTGVQERKRQGRQIDGEKDERGAMQFQVQAGATPGKKMSGAPNWQRKGREGRHAVFKCKQGLQGRKCQGRQTDGEKDERGAMHFKVQAGAPGKKTSGAPNWRRKGREGRHAVSSASRGGSMEKTSGAPNWRRKGREMRHAGSNASRSSREEKLRGAKLTEKRKTNHWIIKLISLLASK